MSDNRDRSFVVEQYAELAPDYDSRWSNYIRPNGVVIITDWCDDYLTCKLCDIYLRWVDPSHFRMYGVSKCRELLEAANAGDIQIEKYKITLLWGLMTATARKRCDASSGK